MRSALSGWLRPLPAKPFWVLLGAYLLLRVVLGLLPGYEPDLLEYRQWAEGIAREGLARAYETTEADYPPLYLYALWCIGKLLVCCLEARGGLDTLLLKTPHLVADGLLAALLGLLVTRLGTWGPDRDGSGWGRTAAMLYLWNPAVLFGSGYWGQPDGVHSLLGLAGIAALAVSRPLGAGALLSGAGWMKPLAAPLVPLSIAAAFRSGGLGAVIRLGIGGLGAALVVFFPFLLSGRLPGALRKVVLELDAMPYTSVNGHNLWWLVGPWRDASGPWLGPLTPQQIGWTLFLALYAMLLTRAWSWLGETSARDVYLVRLITLATAVTMSFFLLSTHMHENHMFLAIPLLLAVAGRHPLLLRLAVGASVAVFVNMVLHDLKLPYALPGPLSAPSPVHEPFYGRPLTWLQLVGSFLNTLLVTAVTAGCVWVAWRGFPDDGERSVRGARPQDPR